MIGYFALMPDGAALVSRHRRLARWWSEMSRRAAFTATTPDLPQSAG
jgi:hypothetical protein